MAPPLDTEGHTTGRPTRKPRLWEWTTSHHSRKALLASILLLVLMHGLLVPIGSIPRLAPRSDGYLMIHILISWAILGSALLILAATALLLAWHLYKRSIPGALFAASTIGLCALYLWFEPRVIALTVWSGVGLAGSVAFFMALRRYGAHWGLIPKGIMVLPLVGTLGLFLIDRYGFSVIDVSNTTPVIGERVSIRIAGIFDVPAGATAVYLFPAQEGPVRGRTETVYYRAEQDNRHTAAVEYVAFSRPFAMPTFFAGETQAKCQGGDICWNSKITIPGTYQIGVAIPHPFLPWNTLLIPGPSIDIAVSDAQREAAHLEDEAAFLYNVLCDAVQTRQTTSWAFLREHHSCGGFLGARAGTDPDVPVWDEERETADTRPPMSIEGGMLCLRDTAQSPYTGQAKVCMPYAGDPQAPLPERDTIHISFAWGGSVFWIFEDEAISTFNDLAREEGKKRFPGFDLPHYAGILRLDEQGDGYHTFRFGHLEFYTPRDDKGRPLEKTSVSSVLATFGPDRRLCLFYTISRHNNPPDAYFTDPDHWEECTAIVDPPQNGDVAP